MTKEEQFNRREMRYRTDIFTVDKKNNKSFGGTF